MRKRHLLTVMAASMLSGTSFGKSMGISPLETTRDRDISVPTGGIEVSQYGKQLLASGKYAQNKRNNKLNK